MCGFYHSELVRVVSVLYHSRLVRVVSGLLLFRIGESCVWSLIILDS